MPGRFQRKKYQPSSKLYASMASPSSTRPKPFFFSRHFGYIGRSATLPCALIAFVLVFIFYKTWKHAVSQGSKSHFYSFDIVNEFPHDPQAFTQGLLYQGNDTLVESTGMYGRSTVRKVDLRSGEVKSSYEMDGSLFGEGITSLGDRLFQVTWLQKSGFIYDQYNLSKGLGKGCTLWLIPWLENVICQMIGGFAHPMMDGWGLATDGKVIFGSDGSSTLYQLDPDTWKAIKKTTVKYRDHEISLLNELEYVNGEVWANIFLTDCIARISHDNGSVLSWILLHGLRTNLINLGHTGIDVLNGIAWDEKSKRLFVTGKLWPKLYEIKLRPVTPPSDGSIEKLCPIRAF